MKYIYLSIVGFLFGLVLIQAAQATHLRAGEITAEGGAPNDPLKFCFTLTTYTDVAGNQANEPDTVRIFFGDGTSAIALRTNGKGTPIGDQTLVNYFKICHTFPAAGLYIVRAGIQNRNAGTVNIGTDPAQISFFVETKIYINSGNKGNRTPLLANPPVDRAIVGQQFCHNPGAKDPDGGDSLAYRLVKPKREKAGSAGEGIDIIDYQDPATGPDFAGGRNEANTGPATFSIDPFTGMLCWDAPKVVGQYNIAFIVEEWRAGVKIGETTRDMQIIVTDGTNQHPNLILPNDTCVVAGYQFKDVKIRATDPDPANQLTLTSISSVYDPAFPSRAVFTTPIQPQSNPAIGLFNWTTICDHIRGQPYDILFKAEDNPTGQTKLAALDVWRIKVVAPQPTNLVAKSDVAAKSITLTWNAYPCQRVGAEMLIWRKIGCTPYTPSLCETGLSPVSGYQVVGKVPLGTTTFTDTNGSIGLESAIEYSYRISVEYGLPMGGASYASEQVCAHLALQVPLITHVTVDKTNKLSTQNNGEITVRWLPPLELDTLLYPKPYSYRVLRAEGQNGVAFSEVSGYLPANISGTLLYSELKDAGLNTKDRSYRYKIEFYYTNNAQRTLVDTSRSASSVRLDSLPLIKGVQLTWKTKVPWSNENQTHVIYRESRKNPGSYTKIAEVPVKTPASFTYTDLGIDQVPSDGNETITLSADSVYCYKVETVGKYSFLDSLFRNFSQEICATPRDTTRPCPPVLSIDTLICQDYYNNEEEPDCNVSTYSNQLRWRYPSKAADKVTNCKDVVQYNLYFRRYEEDTFELIASINSPVPPDTSFLHGNLASYAGCYYVTAVDRQGNESHPSNTVCKDNCPYFELPNIITPNGDGKNDIFQPLPCPQFVESVQFTVYNRWGKKVYQTSSHILIRWDGRVGEDGDKNAKELSTGVYYYTAKVRFSRLRRQDELKIIKGWVQVLR